jgi:hypothetical protein
VAPGSGGASVAASLLLPGSGTAIQNCETAYNAATGVPIPGFPSKLQGLDFLGGPAIADVTGDGRAEVVNAADSSALQAFTQTGAEAPGFPKFTTGWVVYAPAVGDLDSDGRSEVVAATREGYLFVWKTPGTWAGNQEAWRSSHDEHNTDAYGNDTRPPGAIRDLVATGGGGQVTFTAPGDDWYAGTPTRYRITFDLSGGGTRTRTVTATAPAGATVTIAAPADSEAAHVFAVDDAGNRDPTATTPIP